MLLNLFYDQEASITKFKSTIQFSLILSPIFRVENISQMPFPKPVVHMCLNMEIKNKKDYNPPIQVLRLDLGSQGVQRHIIQKSITNEQDIRFQRLQAKLVLMLLVKEFVTVSMKTSLILTQSNQEHLIEKIFNNWTKENN